MTGAFIRIKREQEALENDLKQVRYKDVIYGINVAKGIIEYLNNQFGIKNKT